MHKIYTSYFSAIKMHGLNANDCLSIALYPPKGLNVSAYPKLYPSFSILMDYKHGKISTDEYALRYKEEVLNKLNPKVVSEELDGKILLCYEKSENFCHRQIVANLLNESGYAIVREIK